MFEPWFTNGKYTKHATVRLHTIIVSISLPMVGPEFTDGWELVFRDNTCTQHVIFNQNILGNGF